MTWEYVISDFVKLNNNEKFFILKNQFYNWVNVNTPSDVILARKLFEKKFNMKNKLVYIAFSVDILHEGHINILKKASAYGEVIVGLLTDKAIASYKTLPHFTYDKRKLIIESVKYVSSVVPQETLDYTKNLNSLKPDYVVHGDDWKNGFQKSIRAKVIKL